MSRVVLSLLKSAAVVMRSGGVNPDDPRNARGIAEAWAKAQPEHWRRLAVLSGLPSVPPMHQQRFLEELEARVT